MKIYFFKENPRLFFQHFIIHLTHAKKIYNIKINNKINELLS